MQRRLTSKHNIRPSYTSETKSWNESTNYSTKKYKQPNLTHSKSQPNTYYHKKTPSLSSSSTSCSAETETETPFVKKGPLGSEDVLKIMDKMISEKQQWEQKSLEHSPKFTVNHSLQQQRLERVLSKPIRKCGSIKKSLGQQASNIVKHTNVLSQDDEEQDRMVEQHYLLRTAFGADFSCPLQAQLEKGIVVLDVGCGPGTWTMEMSSAFPNSTFIGMDRNSVFPKFIKPQNCHFRTCDSFVKDKVCLPFPDNSIDYIYQRDMNLGLESQTWRPLVKEFQRILKPGGWLEFVELNLEAQDRLEKESCLNDKLITGLCLRQQDPYTVHHLPTLLSNSDLDQVETITQSFRLGWVSSTNETIDPQQEIKNTKVARAMSGQYTNLLKSLKPWLSTVMDISQDEYDHYLKELQAEWLQAKTFLNWHCIIAQKPL